MLANVLAALLGLGSFTFYMAAFVYPEVHRRSDFVWSGLGLLYAAALWFGAQQMTPVVLLGQMVSVALLMGLGWQTLTVRREKTPVSQQTPIVLTPEVVSDWAKSRLNQLRIAPSDTVRPATLKDRPIEGASTERLRQGLNPSLDPRRRPLYDYEFVEDGALDSDAQESLASAEDIETLVSEVDHIDPPSAIAEVLAIQPEVPTDSKRTQPIESGSTMIEEGVATEIERESETTHQKIEPERVAPKVKSARAEDSDIKESNTEAVDKDWFEDAVDDWDNDLEAKVGETAPDRVSVVRSPQKPSLLAVPIILFGWIRDVARSLTQAKPSKPVIEIPRRDSSLGPNESKAEHTTEDEAEAEAEDFSKRRFDDDDDGDWID
ncbi:hypothetical protein S7335_5377 [Synechococcus sp. PCC 7335]|uniref:Ycf66 family protein n=1 Tax=Synechococcus sp. (strain ATCC 29403 / PCC 7335) TaxID=91464 RepID=UPI00017ED24B|nr:Ycf66 family protein [Synechococcus sp. PCC 7335]EDX87667.1 hypothetical protein S7335_5377 [Synechococcus sp. PCC 7335]